MHLAVEGGNFFHSGWLACFLGMPRRIPHGSRFRDAHRLAWFDGWDTCDNTPTEKRLWEYNRMCVLDHISVGWIDNEGQRLGEDHPDWDWGDRGPPKL